MKFSKPKQFWEWFKRNSENYMQLDERTKAESTYYIREMDMHLMAFGKGICAELRYTVGTASPNGMFIFTAYGRSRRFRAIEQLVAKAPLLPGWIFVGLHPPVAVDHGFASDFPNLDIDPLNIWFELPKDHNGRYYLTAYIEMYKPPSRELEEAVYAAVYNVLGEKTFGLGVRHIEVENLFHVSKERREALINIVQLPECIQISNDSLFVINQLGQVVQRK